MPQSNTYMAIPPPPLPEFYLSKEISRSPASSVSSAECGEVKIRRSQRAADTIRQTHGFDGVEERTEHRRISFNTMRVPPGSSVVPPLAVYHICRICHRPRSARYHREHPIPIDGVPPPPSICRRCRVTPVDHVGSAKVVNQNESEDVRLGLKCFLPDEDYFSYDDMKEKRAKYILSQVGWQEVKPQPKKETRQEEMIFPHSHINAEPPVSPPSPAIPPTPPLAPEPHHTVEIVNRKAEETAPNLRGSTMEFAETKLNADAKALKAKRRSSSHHTFVSVETCRPKYTESHIRGLAREEVQRYRQAERKIESHKHPYSHGRLVPVERRIELEQDDIKDKPWKRQNISRQRDSALVAGVFSNADKDEKTAAARQNRNDHIETGCFSPPSEDSDKTLWPSQEGVRSSRTQQRELHIQQPPLTSNEAQECSVMEVVKHWDYPSRREAPRLANSGSAKNAGITMSGEACYGTDEKRFETSKKEQRTSSLHREVRELPERSIAHQSRPRVSTTAAKASRDTKSIIPSSSYQPSLPYPCDDQDTLASMPSLHSHRSGTVKGGASPDRDREYYYVKRTIQPADQRSATQARSLRESSYYKETKEHLHRRRVPAQTSKVECQNHAHQERPKRERSVTSSRVRFSNKVDVSPTPPGSDASSSRFRNVYKGAGQLDGQEVHKDEDVAAEYERRGRPRSREPLAEQQYHFERDVVRTKGSRHAVAREMDRDRTPRPVHGYRRASDTSEPSTVPSNVRRWARVLSESPSREKLLEEAGERNRLDGAGPYTVEERRSDSVDAEDGSSGSSGDDSDRHKRERYQRERRTGQRSKF